MNAWFAAAGEVFTRSVGSPSFVPFAIMGIALAVAAGIVVKRLVDDRASDKECLPIVNRTRVVEIQFPENKL